MQTAITRKKSGCRLQTKSMYCHACLCPRSAARKRSHSHEARLLGHAPTGANWSRRIGRAPPPESAIRTFPGPAPAPEDQSDPQTASKGRSIERSMVRNQKPQENTNMVIQVNFSRFHGSIEVPAPVSDPRRALFHARHKSRLAHTQIRSYAVVMYRFPPAQQTAVKRGEPSLPPFFFACS